MDLVIEESIPDHLEDFRYVVVWRGNDPHQAMTELQTSTSANRLELWSKAHAEGPQGFAPMAWRAANSAKVMITHTFALFGLNLSGPEMRTLFP